MLKNVFVAIAYFYFHCRYLALVAVTLRRPRIAKPFVVATYFLNYMLFFVCSVLELNLIFNWALFFLLLLGETLHFCKTKGNIALFFSLSGILFGLSVNIFCRCVVAIVIDQPLTMFDNRVSDGSLKFLPVFLGFFLGGLIMHILAQPGLVRQLRDLIEHPEHLVFQLELMAVMYIYLSLNLLLYQSQGDSTLLKLWGIKSCVFAMTGFYLGLRYSLRMCRLSDYREQNRVIERELTESERVEAQLRTIAYRDPLTGAYNRHYAQERLEVMMAQNIPFALCFLDLDDLKGVNDGYGHEGGDRYIVAAAQELVGTCRENRDILARFGGDEFLLVFPGADTSVVEARLQQVNQQLQNRSGSEEHPYAMSLSFGVVASSAAADVETLLAAADEAMYNNKRARRRR